MSIAYKDDGIVIGVEGLSKVEKELGNIRSKLPAVEKFAINKTARYTRKIMIQQAKTRYALNAAGQRHLKDLQQKKKATNSDATAELFIASMQNDLGYFTSSPKRPYVGMKVFGAPEYFKGKVLKASPLKNLSGTAKLSKGFLLEFSSGHVGMVQRVVGSSSKNKVTKKGRPRWTTPDGRVEKVQTMGSPSPTAMHNTVFSIVEPEVEKYLEDALLDRAERVLEIAKARGK